MILVPVKNLVDAKQRLSPILSPQERFALAQAMCEDVLQALARWQSRPAVAVVTNDSFARDLAARFNLRSLPTTTPERPAPSRWPRRCAESAEPTAPWWFRQIFL